MLKFNRKGYKNNGKCIHIKFCRCCRFQDFEKYLILIGKPLCAA